MDRCVTGLVTHMVVMMMWWAVMKGCKVGMYGDRCGDAGVE